MGADLVDNGETNERRPNSPYGAPQGEPQGEGPGYGRGSAHEDAGPPRRDRLAGREPEPGESTPGTASDVASETAGGSFDDPPSDVSGEFPGERGQGARRRGGGKDSFTIGEVVERLRPEFPGLSVSKIRYLERRRLINLSRTRGGYRLFSAQDVELLRYILTLQDKEYLPLKVIKKRIEGGAAIGAGADSSGELSRVLEDRTYTREELAETLETETRFVDELVNVGVVGRSGELTQRDAEIARMAQEMAKFSIQPRHLRGIMAAVDREAALFKQVVNPELRSGDDGRVAEAVNKARHLASVDSRMKELMMANVIDSFAP